MGVCGEVDGRGGVSAGVCVLVCITSWKRLEISRFCLTIELDEEKKTEGRATGRASLQASGPVELPSGRNVVSATGAGWNPAPSSEGRVLYVFI